MYLMLLLSKRNIYGCKDTDFSAHLHHRNDKNIRNRVLFHLFAKSIGQTRAILIPFFYHFLNKDEKWICNDEVASISHLGECHSVIT